ncbi:MAG: AI-2E family transporter [Geminicoccaceae bacterium]|nr:AI-2E family transporter [Geminicoccaceae bacterium]
MRTATANPWSPGGFALRALIVFAVGAVFLLLWSLRELLLLVFGGIVVATIFSVLADPLHRVVPGPRSWSVLLGAVLLLVLIGLVFFFFGTKIQHQLGQFVGSVSEGWRNLQGRLEGTALERALDRQGVEDSLPSVGGVVVGIVDAMRSFAGGLLDLFLVVFGGLYFAVQPGLYGDGLLKLVPGGAARQRGREALDAAGGALRLWLMAKAISMLTIGTLVGLGTWLIGLPAPLGLGLFAGVASFVPMLGAIAGAVPALLLALNDGWTLVLWTALVFVLVQQVEGQIVLPLAENFAVSLPPAFTLFAVVAFGLLFGLLGVILSEPLAVAAFVLAKKLWVKEALGEEVDVPGEPAAASEGRPS